MIIRIPDSVARSLRLPEEELEDRLLMELALSLYAQAILSFGKAADLAGLPCHDFGELLTRRGIPRQAGPDEPAEDWRVVAALRKSSQASA